MNRPNNRNRNRRRPRRNRFGPRRPNTRRGISGQDNVTHNVTFRYLQNVVLDQTSEDFNFAIELVNFSPLGNYTKSWMLTKAEGYDKYRVRNINVKASPGKNLDISRRAQTLMFSRYDPTYNELPNTLAGSTEIMFASNTRQQNFGKDGKVLLISGTPKLKRTSGSTASNPLLPVNLQWYNTSDLLNTNLQNRWNLGTVFFTTPKTTGDHISVTLIVTVSVDFRMRKGPININVNSLGNETDSNLYDLLVTEDQLRTNLLSGIYFPIDLKNINISNIGHSVTGDDLLGVQFRTEHDQKVYEITTTQSPQLYCQEI